MKGDQGSLGAARDRHCCLLCGEMSLSPKDKSTHHLFLESVLGMARATTLLRSRQRRGGDGNYPWSIPPPEHWAGMVSGSGLTFPSAGERGRSRAAGQTLQRSHADTACSARPRCGSGTWSPAEQSPHPKLHWGCLGQASALLELCWERQHRAGAAPGEKAGTLPYSLTVTQ